jgi:hypothetical protein
LDVVGCLFHEQFFFNFMVFICNNSLSDFAKVADNVVIEDWQSSPERQDGANPHAADEFEHSTKKDFISRAASNPTINSMFRDDERDSNSPNSLTGAGESSGFARSGSNTNSSLNKKVSPNTDERARKQAVSFRLGQSPSASTSHAQSISPDHSFLAHHHHFASQQPAQQNAGKNLPPPSSSSSSTSSSLSPPPSDSPSIKTRPKSLSLPPTILTSSTEHLRLSRGGPLTNSGDSKKDKDDAVPNASASDSAIAHSTNAATSATGLASSPGRSANPQQPSLASLPRLPLPGLDGYPSFAAFSTDLQLSWSPSSLPASHDPETMQSSPHDAQATQTVGANATSATIVFSPTLIAPDSPTKSKTNTAGIGSSLQSNQNGGLDGKKELGMHKHRSRKKSEGATNEHAVVVPDEKASKDKEGSSHRSANLQRAVTFDSAQQPGEMHPWMPMRPKQQAISSSSSTSSQSTSISATVTPTASSSGLSKSILKRENSNTNATQNPSITTQQHSNSPPSQPQSNPALATTNSTT